MGDRDREAARLAQAFHEAYERLAPSFGYETRKASARPWVEVPEPNRKLMEAVCAEVMVPLLAAERAAATAACAAHVEEHISRAVGRAWIAEEIRALSPEGWVGVRREDLVFALEGLVMSGVRPRHPALDRIRAALARGKGE